jgi:hypothetical protein
MNNDFLESCVVKISGLTKLRREQRGFFNRAHIHRGPICPFEPEMRVGKTCETVDP